MRARYLGSVQQQYSITTTTIIASHKYWYEDRYLLKGLTTRGCGTNEGKTFRVSSTTIKPTQYEKSIHNEQEKSYTIKK